MPVIKRVPLRNARIVRACAVCLFAAIAPSSTIHAQSGELDVTSSTKAESSAPPVIVIPWIRNSGARDYKLTRKITGQVPVSVRITHFNFLRYAPAVNVATEALPQYDALTKLWEGVLSAQAVTTAQNSGTSITATSNPFLTALGSWRNEITAARARLEAALGNERVVPARVALDSAELGTIAGERSNMEATLKTLEGLRSDAWKNVIIVASSNSETYYAQTLYDSELRVHQALVAALNEFVDRAKEIAAGRVLNIEGQKAGTLVTATISVQALGSDSAYVKRARDEKITTIRYVVSSGLPVTFHTGAGYTRLQDVEVKTVRADNGTDAFRLVDRNANAADLIAFLGYEIYDGADRGIQLSLGTGIQSPGEKVYGGVTFKLRPGFLLTFGAVTKEVEKGTDLLSGNLYQNLQFVRKVGGFASISATPF